ncbi:MAG: TolC family protein [Elusimicrobiota bacterium]|nr:TolC family protein [Elusimicrobiota bacterium]
MKEQFAILVLSLTLLYMPVASQQVSPVRVFTLKDCLSCAVNNRKEMIFAQKEREIAKERIKEALAVRYPKIDFLFNYSRLPPTKMPDSKFVVLPQTFDSLLIPKTTFGNYYLSRVSLWQYVYAGGRYSSNLKLAEANIDRAEGQIKVIKNDIEYDVKKAVYKLLACEQKGEVYKTVISSIEAIVSQTKDITRKTEMKNILQNLKNEYSLLTHQYNLLRLSFLNTIGVELDTLFILKIPFEPFTESYELNKLLAWSFEYRPEPKQIQVQEEIDALSVKLSLAARYPTISLGGYYEFSGEKISLEDSSWVTTLNLNLPIFDGWASWSRIKQKRLQYEQQKLRRKDIKDAIRFEVRKAYIDYNFYLRELQEMAKQLKICEESLPEISKKDDLTGINLLVSYLKSKLNYVDAIRENLISLASLEHAVGKSLSEK